MTHPASATSRNPAGHWTPPRLLLKGWWPLAQVGAVELMGPVLYAVEKWRHEGDRRPAGQEWCSEGSSEGQRGEKKLTKGRLLSGAQECLT